MKQWDILSNSKFSRSLNNAFIDELIEVLLINRGITEEKDKQAFLHPDLNNVTFKNVNIDEIQLETTLKRIQQAIEKKQQIIVFGDYDVDGITASCILWETLTQLGAKVTPYIPHRVEEGYGLSIKGIENVVSQFPNVELIITVDNGIVASKAVDYANNQGIDVIITDHHVPLDGNLTLPTALAIVHTTLLCGAGVALILSSELKSKLHIMPSQIQKQEAIFLEDHMAIAALGTIADLVPLTGINRIIVSLGLKQLQKTKRAGLIALYKEAGIESSSIGVYEVSRMIAPRLNAMGRLENAMESLRLICTQNPKRAELLAQKLSFTNQNRQDLTKSSVDHARMSLVGKHGDSNLLYLAHESYQQGIIGLIAGRLVEEYYLPAIVIAKGKIHSKASARSVSGFNIIEFIREASDLLVDVGGHPMAAGFTVETAKIEMLQQKLEEIAKSMLRSDHLVRKLKIDCELKFVLINQNLYENLQKLSPFGMGNPEPTFVSKNVIVEDMRFVGKERQHLKLDLFQSDSEVYEAIGFGMGEIAKDIKIGDNIDVVYTISENEWNSRKKLQLKLKDFSKQF